MNTSIVACLGCSAQVRLEPTGQLTPRWARYELDGRPHRCGHPLASWKFSRHVPEQKFIRLPAAGEAEMLASSRITSRQLRKQTERQHNKPTPASRSGMRVETPAKGSRPPEQG